MKPLALTIVASEPGASGARHGEPVTFGLPFPRGSIAACDGLELVDSFGRARPLQAHILERWSDDSVRWALFHGQVDWPGSGSPCRLGTAPSATSVSAVHLPRVSVEAATATALVVDTGPARFSCSVGGAFPFDRVTNHEGRNLLDIRRSGLRISDADGRTCAFAVDAVDIEEAGPVRASIRWRGHVARARDAHWLDVDVRGHFFAGLPMVRLALTIRNPRAAVHPGNCWELGDEGSALIREAALEITIPGCHSSAVHCSIERGDPLVQRETPFAVYQESSGGEHWNSRAHVNRVGRVPMEFCGYRLTAGDATVMGRRASPIVTLESDETILAAVAPGFWQNFPRAIEVYKTTLTVGLWPRQFPDLHELQGGEQKTHEVVLSFGRDLVSEIPLDWCRTPALLHADPAWYCDSGAISHLVPEDMDPSVDYRALVRSAIEGSDTFTAKRERIDEYGWRSFGDIYADHENPHDTVRRGDSPVVSHYNNQYDAIAGFALQFFRSGDVRWWTQMAELASHVVDIDLYHATTDKSAYSGGPFWHTAHYVDAGRSTHRAYPSAPGVPGGGPSCEHNYTAGLVLHYLLTGNQASRDAVVGLADWVLRIDDGALTPFRWLARSATGLASATREPGFHGPGRGAANSISTLLDGHRLTGRDVYLDQAERLIRRCVHPDDDIEERGLLDAERRWSYTVFLQVLGRYLDDRAESGRCARMYAWARESLLRYARWMALRERPYLNTPDQLEYPTETWAAQDMRKCEVLLLASLHGRDAEERGFLRERAMFFYTSSIGSLRAVATRTLARPVVILLTNGLRAAWFADHPEACLPEPEGGPHDFGGPERFVPQKARAIARATWAMGSAAGLGTAGLLGMWLW